MLAQEIMDDLKAALEQFEAIAMELEEAPEPVPITSAVLKPVG